MKSEEHSISLQLETTTGSIWERGHHVFTFHSRPGTVATARLINPHKPAWLVKGFFYALDNMLEMWIYSLCKKIRNKICADFHIQKQRMEIIFSPSQNLEGDILQIVSLSAFGGRYQKYLPPHPNWSIRQDLFFLKWPIVLLRWGGINTI